MDENNRPNLDDYIKTLCAKAGVDSAKKPELIPGVNVVWEPTLKEIIKTALIQNWENAFKAGYGSKQADISELIRILTLNEFNFPLISEESILNYIEFSKRFFGLSSLINNINQIETINYAINNLPWNLSHCFIYGEVGTRKEQLGEVLISRIELINTFDNIRKFYCNSIEDLTEGMLVNSYNSKELFIKLYNDNVLTKGGKAIDADELEKMLAANKNLLSYIPFMGFGYKRGLRILIVNDIMEKPMEMQKLIRQVIERKAVHEISYEEKLKITIVLIITITTGSDSDNANSDKMRFEYLHDRMNHTFFINPLRENKCDIPMLIYMYARNANRKYLAHHICFPYPLIKYWIKDEPWLGNQTQLAEEVTEYVSKFCQLEELRESKATTDPDTYRKYFTVTFNDNKIADPINSYDDKKNLFMTLLKLPSSRAFASYINNCDLEPFDLIYLDEIISRPYQYFACRQYDRKSKSWDISIEALKSMLTIPISINSSSSGGKKKFLVPQDNIDSQNYLAIPDDSESKRREAGSEHSHPKYDTIVAEVADDGSEFPKIKLVSKDEKKEYELKMASERKAWFSVLVYLIYERTNRDENKNPKNVKWGLRWHKLIGSDQFGPDKFKPIDDICRWFGYLDTEDNIKLPSWWEEDYNLGPTISNLRKTFIKNHIFQEIIISEKRPSGPPIFHLHEDLKARIDNLKK
jgi:hypothetical protein